MKKEIAKEQIRKIENDNVIQNLIAQGKSRYILYNVNEPEKNFPRYTASLTEKNNHTAYAYLNAGCHIAEEGAIVEAGNGLRKGASILEYNFKSSRKISVYSDYFLLTVALANYAAFEYSKAFVAISKLEYSTRSAKLLSKFLSKRFQDLDKEITSIQISKDYLQKNIIKEKPEGSSIIHIKIYDYLLSKSLANVLTYFQFGDEERIKEAIQIATDMMELLTEDEEPSLWWCIRLYRIILHGFDQSAIWKILPPHFPGNEEIVTSFIKNLANRKPVPIVEFFISQRESISKTISESGLVVSLPTSSGKTRIAEIAILNTLLEEESIVLYIAPFRSLAFEVEDTLELTFESLGFPVSHLYGGASFSKIDRLEIENTRILVATPEKAKALFRAADDLVDKVKLVVIDEGHLLGAEERFIRNEMFYEELRYHMMENNGKFIILSAVLPNPDHISKWLTDTDGNIHKDTWKPSSRRLGTLEFKDNNVNINWRNEDPETWNYSFIEPIKNGDKIIPSNLKEAISLTAKKLSENGSVLIFLPISNRVISQGKACLEAFGKDNKDHKWNNIGAWNSFEMAVKNSLGYENSVYLLAKHGIICHYAKLPKNIKAAIENLMRSSNPRIIIATTTLAQGVNLGVSTVIIGDVWFGAPGNSPKISKSKFWNIVGRAGRAFVDSEGKVLYAIDKNNNRKIVRKRERLADSYLNEESHDKVYSGLFLLLKYFSKIAKEADVDIEYLVQLITENSPKLHDLDLETEDISLISESFDLIDDTLLSLSYKLKSYNDDDTSEWIDKYFRSSLCFIQASENKIFDQESLLNYLKIRNSIIIKQVGGPENWLSHIRTGIPVRASIKLESLLGAFEEAYTEYRKTEEEIEDFSNFVQNIENLIDQLPGESFAKKTVFRNRPISDERHNAIHYIWLSGDSYLNIIKATTVEITNYYCSSYFGYTLPWLFNAVSRKFKSTKNIECADFYENLATIVELGLPNMRAVKNYLGGIKSRPIATEISNVINTPMGDSSLSEHVEYLISVKELYIDDLSEDAIKWLNVLEKRQQTKSEKVLKFPYFNFDLLDKNKVYSVKVFNDKSYLCNSDYSSKFRVKSTEKLPFKSFGHKLGCYFKYNEYNEAWSLNQ